MAKEPKLEKEKVGRKWFDGKDEESVLTKCKEVWAIDGTDEEASFYGEVSTASISRYLKAHPEVYEIRNRLKQKPVLKARQTVVKSLDNPDMALKYLERKRKAEFSVRNEVTGEGGGAIKINIVQYGNNDTIELPTEDLSTSVTKLPEQIQNSGMAQKKRKIKNRPKRPDKKNAA